MKIGQLATATGLSASSIRFYESVGLIAAVERQGNGYRDYPDSAVQLLNIIKCGQQVGFSLDEIRAMLPSSPEQVSWPREPLLEGLRRKLQEVRVLQQRLVHTEQQLQGLIASVEAKPDSVTCADHAQELMARFADQVLSVGAETQAKRASPQGDRSNKRLKTTSGA